VHNDFTNTFCKINSEWAQGSARQSAVLQKSIPAQIRQLVLYYFKRLTNLCGNRLIQDDFINTLCKINSEWAQGSPSKATRQSADGGGQAFHTWIIAVIVKQHPVQIGRIDGPTEYLSTRTSLGGVPREQKMLKGHLPRVICHRVYSNIRRLQC
jgi:hypothetical protein